MDLKIIYLILGITGSILALEKGDRRQFEPNDLELKMTPWDPDCYNEHSKLQQVIAKNFLKILKQKFGDIPAPFQLLDIGSGSGGTTRLILDAFPEIQILGVDSSEEMVQFANRHYANGHLSFQVDRAEELKSLGSNQFDAIASFACLHWVKDKKNVFAAMHRVLKLGGWMGLLFAAETGYDDPIDHAYDQAIHEFPWAPYFEQPKKEVNWHIEDPKIVRSQLEELGFQVGFMGTQDSVFSFHDEPAFQRWVFASFQQLKLLPKNLQESCAARIVELFLQSTSHLQIKKPQCLYPIDGFMLIAEKPHL